MNKRTTTIIDTIRRKQLFGSLPAFESLETWVSWLIWLKAIYALPMDDGELAIYRQCTGRTQTPTTPPHTTLLRRASTMSHSKKGGMQCLGAEMEYFYKDHRVEISVGLDGDGWVVSLFIYYSDKLQNLLVTFPMDQTFKTYDAAMKAGLAAAQKWIDERTTNPRH